jgi:uncharacterized protein (TIGR02217 family)
VAGTVLIAIGGVTRLTGWNVDTTTGLVTFGTAPAAGAAITAGFQFHVPVRFDTDYLEFTMSGPDYGEFVDIPVVEIRV